MASKKPALAIVAEPEQLEMDLPLSDQYLIRLQAEQIRLACKAYCHRKYKEVAGELDAIFGDSLGHPVSESTLRAGLDGTERNYWRGEWLPYFAKRIPEVAALLVQSTPQPLTGEQKWELMKALGPTEGGSAIARLISKIDGGGK